MPEPTKLLRVCFTGGGTGGHVFPAFAVDEFLSAQSRRGEFRYERFWIGSRDERERRWIEEAGFRHVAISTGKLRRYVSLRNITDLFGIVAGFFQSLAILRRERPDILFSKGGFVSVPPVLAAWMLRIPSITHESDATAGLATRINARCALHTCIPFPEAAASYPRRLQGHLVVTGVPSRLSRKGCDANRARAKFALTEDKPVVVVLGGSQGALQINELVWDQLDQLLRFAQVVHQTGPATYRTIEKRGYRCVPFIGEELGDLLSAATLVVSRAGATALADFMEMEVAMLLIPLGLGESRGDQIENARRLERYGAAWVLDGNTVEQGTFTDAVRKLSSHAIVRNELVSRAKALHAADAAERIAHLICSSARVRRD